VTSSISDLAISDLSEIYDQSKIAKSEIGNPVPQALADADIVSAARGSDRGRSGGFHIRKLPAPNTVQQDRQKKGGPSSRLVLVRGKARTSCRPQALNMAQRSAAGIAVA
jgi:hypothetical protein